MHVYACVALFLVHELHTQNVNFATSAVLLTGNLFPSDWLHCMEIGEVLYMVFSNSEVRGVHLIAW